MEQPKKTVAEKTTEGKRERGRAKSNLKNAVKWGSLNLTKIKTPPGRFYRCSTEGSFWGVF